MGVCTYCDTRIPPRQMGKHTINPSQEGSVRPMSFCSRGCKEIYAVKNLDVDPEDL